MIKDSNDLKQYTPFILEHQLITLHHQVTVLQHRVTTLISAIHVQ